MIGYKFIKLFLRFAISFSFISAVADRIGWWSPEISFWGNWNSFVEYTAVLNPWFPAAIIPFLALFATILEVVFAVCLIVGLKTELMAKLSGVLLLIFALSMTFSSGIKGAFDFSVFSASAGAFALGLMKEKFLELDNLIWKSKY